jgi:antitoxin VapB
VALNIKDPETDRIARELSAATGESITVAVRVAMEERLRRVRARPDDDDADSEIDQIIARIQRLPVLDDRSPDDIIGYDENGLPA